MARKPLVYDAVLDEENQGHPTRRGLFEDLSRHLKRPVVSFFTSFRFPVMIEDDDADMLEGVLQSLDLANGLALFINSPGGDGLAAERIVNMCRAYSGTGEYWTIVPGKAKSAATIVCFGASRLAAMTGGGAMKRDNDRLESARSDLRRIKEEIAPFVKERDRRKHTTAGQWQDSRRAAAERTGRVQRKRSGPN